MTTTKPKLSQNSLATFSSDLVGSNKNFHQQQRQHCFISGWNVRVLHDSLFLIQQEVNRLLIRGQVIFRTPFVFQILRKKLVGKTTSFWKLKKKRFPTTYTQKQEAMKSGRNFFSSEQSSCNGCWIRNYIWCLNLHLQPYAKNIMRQQKQKVDFCEFFLQKTLLACCCWCLRTNILQWERRSTESVIASWK